jgi:integrase/recombinase XerD
MDRLDQLFAEFLRERVYLRNVSPKTRLWYETAWKAFRREHPDGDGFTRPVLQRFVLGLRERGVRPVSVNTYLKAMNAFGRWLHAEGHASERVALPPLKTPRRLVPTLDAAALRGLLRYRTRGFRECRTLTVVATILDTGCRIEELLDAAVSAVDLENLLITVRGKGDKERKVPFSFELRKLLFRYLQQRERRGLRSPFLFPSLSGAKWSQRNALRSYYLLQRKAGLPTKSGFHRLRHTFSTEYLRAGGDVVRLSRILGHAHISTTMRYVHLLTEDLQRPHQTLSILNRLR